MVWHRGWWEKSAHSCPGIHLLWKATDITAVGLSLLFNTLMCQFFNYYKQFSLLDDALSGQV